MRISSPLDLKKVAFYTNRNKHVPAMLAKVHRRGVSVSATEAFWCRSKVFSNRLNEIFRDLVRLGDEVGAVSSSRRRPDHVSDWY